MSYRQIKWLILIIPTLTIGIWEYVRHEFLLPYISMNLGNWLAPVIVFLVSVLFLTKLFAMIEQYQHELNRTKALKAILQEREILARELHDGIAQSLFLLNVQVNQIEQTNVADQLPIQQFKQNVHRTNSYVRQAIANLRYPADRTVVPWMQAMDSLIDEMRRETSLQFEIDWNLPETQLTTKEKVELLASIRECLLNIHKHANAKHVWIHAEAERTQWRCTIADDGQGFHHEDVDWANRFGIRMMEDRAKAMDWHFEIVREQGKTIVIISKEFDR